LYAKYLLGARNRLPVAPAAPSLFSLYGSPPRLEGALVLAISQSGQSPDILAVVEEGNRQGVPTLAITNDPASPLGRAAGWAIDLRAGTETAVAATKTYAAELMAIALLSVALQENADDLEALRAVPSALADALALEAVISEAADSFVGANRCVVIGRGFNYATAHEWALKLSELAYLVAQPYSSADFLHGPIAMIEPEFPVFLVAPCGRVYPQLLELASRLRTKRMARLLVISDRAEILRHSMAPLRLPEQPEWLSPLASIVPAQLFCLHLARARGLDLERPRGLTKITRTT
jgi:glucosamine--fructose-6-phosphate aminotransferase (isomerizing)